ncbi:hypothetical protein C8R45DRAFT_943445 [Mycena sanguinolenta]|nr:hypothetical protein C8R45DRAFT_943445 [Mycena sanguinolenta]
MYQGPVAPEAATIWDQIANICSICEWASKPAARTKSSPAMKRRRRRVDRSIGSENSRSESGPCAVSGFPQDSESPSSLKIKTVVVFGGSYGVCARCILVLVVFETFYGSEGRVKILTSPPSPGTFVGIQTQILALIRNTISLARAFPELGNPSLCLECQMQGPGYVFDELAFAVSATLDLTQTCTGTAAVVNVCTDGERIYIWAKGENWYSCVVFPVRDLLPNTILSHSSFSPSIDMCFSMDVNITMLGIEFVTDLAQQVRYPSQSRTCLQRFDANASLCPSVLQALESSNVDAILSDLATRVASGGTGAGEEGHVKGMGRGSQEDDLEWYKPGEPAIKVSFGFVKIFPVSSFHFYSSL